MPMAHTATVAAVRISACGRPIPPAIRTKGMTVTASAIPPGSALRKTFMRKSPRIRSLFGACARKKDGIPIVNAPIRVIWRGSSG